MPKQVTVWMEPEKSINSEYGIIPYKDWCEKEKSRLNGGYNYSIKKGVSQGKDCVALFRTKGRNR